MSDEIEPTEPAGGFQIEFQNGNTISVMFRYGNYCANRDNRDTMNYRIYNGPYDSSLMLGFSEGKWWSCENAEIAIWDSNNAWYDFRYDQVIGWQSKQDVAEYVEIINHAVDREDLQFKITTRGD